MHTVQIADQAKPAAIRKARKLENETRRAYHESRATWYDTRDEDALWDAIDARYWYQIRRTARLLAERIRDEMADGKRDFLGRTRA